MMKRNSRAVADAGLRSRESRRLQAAAVTVLHVDDDPNDTELLRAAVRKASIQLILHNLEDAEHAIAYLSGQGIYADHETYHPPGLILLDLKMPRMTGFEVLRWIRQHQEFGHIPVLVLSGSELRDDIQRAYDMGANAYLVKPIGFEALVQMVKHIHASWVAALPQASAERVAFLPDQ